MSVAFYLGGVMTGIPKDMPLKSNRLPFSS